MHEARAGERHTGRKKENTKQEKELKETTKEQTCKQQHQTNPRKSYVKLDYCHKKYTFTSFSCAVKPLTSFTEPVPPAKIVIINYLCRLLNTLTTYYFFRFFESNGPFPMNRLLYYIKSKSSCFV